MVKYYVIKEMLSDSHTITCILKFSDPNTALMYARYLDNQDPMCVIAKHRVAEYKDVNVNQFPINKAHTYIAVFNSNNKNLRNKSYTSIGI